VPVDDRRRRNDDRLDQLYDALIGSPGTIGALEEFRADIREMKVRANTLDRLYEAHLQQHVKDDENAEKDKRTIRDVLLRLAERAVVAIVAAAMSVYVAAQTFLQDQK